MAERSSKDPAVQVAPNSAPCSRRAMLLGTVGGLVALAAPALGRPQAARAANGDAVTVGNSFSGTAATTISRTGATFFTHYTIQGSSDGGTGVAGSSSTNLGVYGWSGSGTGVVGETTSGTGVVGESHGTSGVGVIGFADASSGPTYGVKGSVNSPSGVGGYFTAPAAGVALQANGRVKFSRSGKTLITAGHSKKTISLAGVTSSSLIFAVLRSNRSGRWVRAVVPATGSFTVYLNTSLGSNTYVVWFVLN